MHFYKYILILNLILFVIFYSNLKSDHTDLNSKFIFTFWEPYNEVPGYLHLCIKTWKKFLPEYKIIILNYSSLPYYLSSRFISKILCKNMTLKSQADGIRVALLHKYGGIWMDMDTIITNSHFLEMFKGVNLAMFGYKKENTQHIGFIYASKNSKILKVWLKYIIKRVSYYRFISFFNKYFHNNYTKYKFQKLQKWDYLGNGIIDQILINVSKKDYLRVESDEMHICPESYFIRNGSFVSKYQKFYFSKGDAEKIFNFSKGIICLHNSWTPNKYKNMTESQFLQLNLMISQLLKLLLKI